MMAPFTAQYRVNDWTVDRTQTVNLSTASNPFSIVDWTVTETNPKGKVTKTVYTGSNRTYVSTSPLGRQWRIATDAYERVLSAQLGNETPTELRLEQRAPEHRHTGRTQCLAGLRSDDGPTTKCHQCPQSADLICLRSCGPADRAHAPDNQAIRFEYDANGNVTSITPPGRSAHRFDSDALEMPASYTPPALATVANPATTFAWNLDRQLTQVTRPNGDTISYNYDAASGALTSISTPTGNYVVEQTAAGRLNTVTSPDNIRTEFVYDDSYGRPTGQNVWNSANVSVGRFTRQYGGEGDKPVSDSVISADGLTSRTIAYSYDDDELLVGAGALTLTRSAATGRVTRTQIGNVTDVYGYNTLGELISYEAKYAGASVYKLLLSRDPLGRIKSRTETLDGVTTVYGYTYDGAGRLITVTRGGQQWQSYVYDANGNRTGGHNGASAISASYDEQDRLTQYNGVEYDFNANGELIRTTDTQEPRQDPRVRRFRSAQAGNAAERNGDSLSDRRLKPPCRATERHRSDRALPVYGRSADRCRNDGCRRHPQAVRLRNQAKCS